MTFKTWRKKKKLTIMAIAKQLNLDYNTVDSWDRFPGREPRAIFVERIQQHFPDCPLAG